MVERAMRDDEEPDFDEREWEDIYESWRQHAGDLCAFCGIAGHVSKQCPNRIADKPDANETRGNRRYYARKAKEAKEDA